MLLLRLYLLAGLVAHKAVWEVLKRRGGASKAAAPVAAGGRSLAIRAVKVVKVSILLGIVAQTLLPTILPILP
jgi:hypothetical protein